MEFKFTRFPSSDPNFPHFVQSRIDLRLYRGEASTLLTAQLDTGADLTLFNSKVADELYIDWKRGKETSVIGIDGKQTKAYLHDLEIEIEGMPGSKVKTTVAFVPLRSVGVILGHYGFFEHFNVAFNSKNESFTIELAAGR